MEKCTFVCVLMYSRHGKMCNSRKEGSFLLRKFEGGAGGQLEKVTSKMLRKLSEQIKNDSGEQQKWSSNKVKSKSCS